MKLKGGSEATSDPHRWILLFGINLTSPTFPEMWTPKYASQGPASTWQITGERLAPTFSNARWQTRAVTQAEE